MASIPYSISRIMLRTSSMVMKFSTKILIEESFASRISFCASSFVYNDRTYFVVDSKPSIIISQKDSKGTRPDDGWIYINERNIYYFLSGLKEIRQKMMGDKVYYKEEGKLKMYSLDNSCVLKLTMGNNTTVKICPGIYEDSNGFLYETMNIFVNRPENLIQLNIENLEAVIYYLEKVDFFLYSQALLNFFISSLGKGQIIKEGIPKYVPRAFLGEGEHIIEEPEMQSRTVKPRPKDIFSKSGLG